MTFCTGYIDFVLAPTLYWLRCQKCIESSSSANNRLVGGAALALLGDGGYANAFRAQKIRDDLKAKGHLTEPDLLSIQLDVQASALEPWQKLLIKLLEAIQKKILEWQAHSP